MNRFRRLIIMVLSTAILNNVSAGVPIIIDGQAKAAIFAPAEVMNHKNTAKKPDQLNWRHPTPAMHRQRLKDSVLDLARCLEKISGAKVEVITGSPKAGDSRLPILIGTLATERFGPPSESAPAKQGGRLVVSDQAVGLIGESELATSYVIYELLDRLGCRWFMPSEMGEVLPSMTSISLSKTDEFIAPYTIDRYIWFADDDYGRRNRLGGPLLNHGHALEGYVSKELRAKHPEWNASHKGKPAGRRLKWSKPGVTDAIADHLLARLEKDPTITSFSLSPDDGAGYDDTDDRQLDADDFDPTFEGISLSDRHIWMANRVIERVVAKHPHMKFGQHAYGFNSRPPVREKPHPNFIPVVAPITYRRAHSMLDDRVADNVHLRNSITGWAKLCPEMSYYFYGWLLAEPSAPNPFITKWSEDLRFIYDHGNCRRWEPETSANFDTTMHAVYMSIRMAWNPKQDPKDIIAEIHERFYGHAAKEMAAYWHFVDRVWIECPEDSGAGFGHLVRWTPDKMAEARRLLNQGIAACRTWPEKSRVEMADQSLKLFELFMKLRRDLAEGQFDNLAQDAQLYNDWAIALSKRYKKQFAFTGAYYLRGDSWNAKYFRTFYKKTYDDATRIAKANQILTPPLLWRYQIDREKVGEREGWGAPKFDDQQWKTTNPAVETWATLGFPNHMGVVWYRTTVELDDIPAGKKIWLWLGSTDGGAKVTVNGNHVPYIDSKGKTQEAFNGYAAPASFDITKHVKPKQKNHIAILCDREFLNERGTGGLLGPTVIYRKP